MILDTVTDGQLLDLAPEQLVAAPDNPRTDLGDLDGLIESIQTVGILEPLVVTAHRDDNGRHTIIAGHRRLAAATQAGLTTIPCVVRDLSAEHRRAAMLIENLQRSELSPLDEARGFRALLDLSTEDGEDLTQRRIAGLVGCSQSHVSKRLALTKLPTAAAELLTAGTLTIRQAEQLAALPDDDVGLVTNRLVERAEHTDGEFSSWVLDDAIRNLTTDRKHAAAETTGEKSGLKRLEQRPYLGAGKHEPCAKGKATHWYLGPRDTTIVWARTAAAGNKERAATPAKNGDGTPKGRDQWQIDSEARGRVEDFALAVCDRILTAGDDTTIRDAAARACALDAHHIFTTAVGWREVRLQRIKLGEGVEADAHTYLTCSALLATVSRDWTYRPNLLALFVKLGYRPGEGEVLPDGFEVPADEPGDVAGDSDAGGIGDNDGTVALTDTPDQELPGMWECADFEGGATDIVVDVPAPILNDPPDTRDSAPSSEVEKPEPAQVNGDDGQAPKSASAPVKQPWPRYEKNYESAIIQRLNQTSDVELVNRVHVWELEHQGRVAIIEKCQDRRFELGGI